MIIETHISDLDFTRVGSERFGNYEITVNQRILLERQSYLSFENPLEIEPAETDFL